MESPSRLRPIVAAVLVAALATVQAGAPPAAAEGSEGAPGDARDAAAVLAVGDRHSCVVLDGGDVTCWGANDSGQLGVGDQTDVGDGVGPDVSATSSVDLGGRAAVSVAAGAEHTCALLDDGAVACWGSNGSGQLGLGTTASVGDGVGPDVSDAPDVDLGDGRGAIAIAAGPFHTCAVLDEGSVTCWGANALGQLGQDSTTIIGDATGPTVADSPRVDLDGRRATAIATGVGHTCAVLEDGAVACWGDSTFGQLGLGSIASVGDGTGPDVGDAPDVDLGPGRSAVGVTAGNNHTCVVIDGDQVLCWGFGQFGRLGQGDTQNIGDGTGPSVADTPTIDLGANATGVAVSGGGQHTCAVLGAADAKCWGDNTDGVLGMGTVDRIGDGVGPDVSDVGPVGPSFAGDVLAVAAGLEHSCALFADETVVCWGDGSRGKLGQGDTQNIGDNVGPDPAIVPPIPLGAAVPVEQTVLRPWFVPLDPARLVDTRPGGTTIDGAFQPATKLAADDEITLQVTGRAGVPDDATAVVLNVTANEPDAAGFITAYPCGTTRPNASNLNYTTGETTPNNVIVGVGTNGTVCLYSDQTTHLIADINGAIR